MATTEGNRQKEKTLKKYRLFFFLMSIDEILEVDFFFLFLNLSPLKIKDKKKKKIVVLHS